MGNLYTGEEVSALRRKMQKSILWCVLSLSLALAICVFLCFFVNDENADALLAVNITLSSIGGCVSLYLLLNPVLYNSARYRKIRELTEQPTVTVDCIFCSYGEMLTYRKGFSAREIIVECMGGEKRRFLVDAEKNCPFKENDSVILSAVGNVAVGWEVRK